MRTKLFVLFLCLPVSLYATQESDSTKRFVAGVKASMNFSWMSKFGDYINGSDFTPYVRISLAGGGFAQYRVHESLTLQMELLANTRGGAWRKESGSVVNIGSQGAEAAYLYQKYVVNTIDIPVIVKLNLYKYWMNPYLELGYAPAFKTNAYYTYNEYSGSFTNVTESWESEDLENVNNFFNFLIVGAGVDWLNDYDTPFNAGIRFQIGLNPVFDTNNYSDKTTTSQAVLFVGIGF